MASTTSVSYNFDSHLNGQIMIRREVLKNSVKDKSKGITKEHIESKHSTASPISNSKLINNCKSDSEPPRKKCNSMTNGDNVIEDTDMECSVCLEQCSLPVQLPCLHIFCYLCIKAQIMQDTDKCALCRKKIPKKFLDKPYLLSSVADENPYQWFYKGQNGWWQYDDRSSIEIEEAYKEGASNCEVTIAGIEYIIDFQKLRQCKKCNPYNWRHIKRDLVSIVKKGVAGIGQNVTSKKKKVKRKYKY